MKGLDLAVARAKIYMEAFGKIADLHAPEPGPTGREACSCGETFFELCPTASVVTDAQARADLLSTLETS